MRFTSTILLASVASAAPLAQVGNANGQLLNDVSPDVVALLTGLGLANVGGPVGGILTDA
jgi:hypothetical protein